MQSCSIDIVLSHVPWRAGCTTTRSIWLYQAWLWRPPFDSQQLKSMDTGSLPQQGNDQSGT